MPDLEPVSGNPFAPQLQPISGDPFAEVNGMRNETGWMTEPTFQERWEGLPKETQQAIDELSTKEGLENFLHPKNQEMAIQYLLRNKNKPPAGWAANQLPQFSPSMDRRTVGERERDTTLQNMDPRYPSLQWQHPSTYPLITSKKTLPFDPDKPEVYNYRISDESDMTHWPDQPNHATPYLQALKDAWKPPNIAPIHEPGTQPQDYLNELARNPDIRAATIEQAQPFALMGGALAKTPFNKQGQLGKFQLEDLHKDFQAGLNNQQIANKYNVTKEAIQQRRTQLGYPQKPRGRPWPSRLEPVSHDPFSEE
jgi:hypothetical protein